MRERAGERERRWFEEGDELICVLFGFFVVLLFFFFIHHIFILFSSCYSY